MPTMDLSAIAASLRNSPQVQQIMGLLAWMAMKLDRLTAQKAPAQGFLPDDVLGSGFFYTVISVFFYRAAQFFHGHDVVGLDKLPSQGKGALMVGMHTTHNADIPTVATMFAKETGRVPRGLIHRQVYNFNPWMKYAGMLPGDRATAVKLLQNGFLAACLPGGGEEAMEGHENAYNLGARWADRRGYAQVAKDAGVPIYPVFTKNAEEMRFNPVFWLGNQLRVGELKNRLEKLPVVGNVLKNLFMATWFFFAYATGIPMPVKITTVVGDPIETDGRSVDEIAADTRAALQKLINEQQPHGHAYVPALKERVVELKEFLSISNTKQA